MKKPPNLKEYSETIKQRKSESKAYSSHQLLGLDLAEILNDRAHKSLYMKLAKQYNHQKLLTLAKSVASRKNVKNKGAYFMRLLTNNTNENPYNTK